MIVKCSNNGTLHKKNVVAVGVTAKAFVLWCLQENLGI